MAPENRKNSSTMPQARTGWTSAKCPNCRSSPPTNSHTRKMQGPPRKVSRCRQPSQLGELFANSRQINRQNGYVKHRKTASVCEWKDFLRDFFLRSRSSLPRKIENPHEHTQDFRLTIASSYRYRSRPPPRQVDAPQGAQERQCLS